MNDKDRTLKALEDMKESMAYAVRRRATADVVSLEAQVLSLEQQRDELAEALRAACPDDVELGCDDCAPGPCAGCWVKKARALLRKVDGTAQETSIVAQDK